MRTNIEAQDKIYMLPEVASTVKVLDEEVEYIRKDALLEWAKERKEQMKIEAAGFSNMLAAGEYLAYDKLIEKIESM